MTEEIIKKITEAEAQGAEMKRVATLQGEQIVADANLRAKRMEESKRKIMKYSIFLSAFVDNVKSK